MSKADSVTTWVGIGMGVGLFSIAWPVILPLMGIAIAGSAVKQLAKGGPRKSQPGDVDLDGPRLMDPQALTWSETDEWLEDTVRRCPDFVDDAEEAYFEVLLAEQVRRRIAD